MLPGFSPLAFGSLLAGGTSLALALYAWRERTEPGSTAFALLMVGSTVWSLSYAVALTAFDPGTRVLMEVPIEVGKALVAPAWLAFALGYTGRGEYLTRRTVAGLVAFPAATLVVVSLPALRPLIWTNYRVTPTLGAATVSYDPTLWHYAHAAYGYVLVGAGMALLVDALASHTRLYRRQTLALVVGSLFPTVAHVKRTFQFGPLVAVDFTPMALSVTGLTFGYALFRFDLFDLVPATSYRGRRGAIDDLGVGVVIVANDDRVVELNEEAKRLFGGTDAAVGDPLAAFLPSDVDAEMRTGDGGTFDLDVDGHRRTLEAVPSTIDDPRGSPVGRTIVLNDITEREARRQRLDVFNRVLRHNLRNEMTVVLGYAELLAESLSDEEARYARTIHERSTALADLGEKARGFEEMLDSADVTTSVALDDVVAEVVTDVVDDAPDADPDVSLDVPSELTVETNEQVLTTVLSAVVDNAVTHNDGPSPSVSVTARTATTDGGDGDSRVDDVVIEVEDDGPGIPDDELGVVTEGEETPLTHGSGLGLWLVQWGCRWLGPDPEFEVTENGTTVRFRL
ncbi:HTR-like protein [Salinigranum rubrum]|uniref:histidine kinase n=1 Tax=Salinigranum rubrum TaxID=755307 RepID=A0A2I8VNS7_9EURY|nr:histidine kinase N-terminal 7TM domain-containing protein [Salinigranum rubrum]AUV83534.1 HTR-like protein [Salinigranum rubrum]